MIFSDKPCICQDKTPQNSYWHYRKQHKYRPTLSAQRSVCAHTPSLKAEQTKLFWRNGKWDNMPWCPAGGGRYKRLLEAQDLSVYDCRCSTATCVKLLLFSHLATLSASVKGFGNKFHGLVCVKTFRSFDFVTFQYHWMFPSFFLFFLWKSTLRNIWSAFSFPLCYFFLIVFPFTGLFQR